MAIAGLGMARLSEFHIGGDLASGRLVPLLRDYCAEDHEPVQAPYVNHAHLSDRIRVFLDFVSRIPAESQRQAGV